MNTASVLPNHPPLDPLHIETYFEEQLTQLSQAWKTRDQTHVRASVHNLCIQFTAYAPHCRHLPHVYSRQLQQFDEIISQPRTEQISLDETYKQHIDLLKQQIEQTWQINPEPERAVQALPTSTRYRAQPEYANFYQRQWVFEPPEVPLNETHDALYLYDHPDTEALSTPSEVKPSIKLLPFHPLQQTNVLIDPIHSEPSTDHRMTFANTRTPRCLAIGDLHGHYMKLVHSLQAIGLITLTQDTYHHLAQLGYTHYMILLEHHQRFPNNISLTPSTKDRVRHGLDQMIAIIDAIEVVQPLTHDTLIQLIGDVLSDRGPNDFITLYLIQSLQKKGVSLRICLSNHDIFFMLHDQAPYQLSPRTSYSNYTQLIQNGLLTAEEKQQLAAGIISYIQTIQLISYGIEINKHNGEILQVNVFHHAITGSENLKRLIHRYHKPNEFLFGIEYRANTVEEFCSMIDQINQAFQNMLATRFNVFIALLVKEYYESRNDQDPPLWHILHNRIPLEPFAHWEHINGIPVIAYHGHVGEIIAETNPFYQNLDGDAGKYQNKTCYPGQSPLFCAQLFSSYAAYVIEKNRLSTMQQSPSSSSLSDESTYPGFFHSQTPTTQQQHAEPLLESDYKERHGL